MVEGSPRRRRWQGLANLQAAVSQQTGPQRPPAATSAARARILATADRLFYGEGIRAVGVDRVVAESRVTRVTFYRHFPSKDHLIVAYLQGRLKRDREQLARLRAQHPGDPRAVLTALSTALTADSAAPGFRGCPYLNLTAEYCDADHPARKVAGEHRTWLKGEVEQLLTELEHDRVDVVAEQLVMLRAGAMAVASVGDTGSAAQAFNDAWSTLIDHD
jgi:AcrR family transcriptional regulator